MKLTSQIKLQATPKQIDILLRTIRQANSACNFISEISWKSKIFSQYSIHRISYRRTRAAFPFLSSNIIIQCISRVADAYRIDHKSKRTFKTTSAIAYNDRILHWYTLESYVSIWTVEGRLHLKFVCGESQRELLKTRQGESDLVFRGGKFYLFATCNAPEPILENTADALGVDLGIINIATDSDGKIYSGSRLNGLRYRHRRLRSKLQSKGTKSAKRLLKKRSGKEMHFAKNENHRISKELVLRAKDTKRAIALEDLTGIRSRTTVRKPQRAIHSSWAFYDLRSKIEYKGKRVGVTVIAVNPRNTSRTCPSCGHIDKANRKTQSDFSCVQCGFSGHADHIAAENIRRAAVNQPNAGQSLIAALVAPASLCDSMRDC